MGGQKRVPLEMPVPDFLLAAEVIDRIVGKISDDACHFLVGTAGRHAMPGQFVQDGDQIPVLLVNKVDSRGEIVAPREYIETGILV